MQRFFWPTPSTLIGQDKIGTEPRPIDHNSLTPAAGLAARWKPLWCWAAALGRAPEEQLDLWTETIGHGSAVAWGDTVFVPVVLRAWRREFERCRPQECEIDGPAVLPMTAPPTAPIGPSTKAPDTAPNAASPARSPAIAAEGISTKARATLAIVFLIIGSFFASLLE